MAIQAIALLRIPNLRPPASSNARLTFLDDAVLVHTGADFASEPAALTDEVRLLLGEEAKRHHDPRGVFFIPSVAVPSARRYDDVVAEIGEGGMWGPALDTRAATPGAGGLEAMLGGMLGQLPEGMFESVTQAAARGDVGSLQSLAIQMQARMHQDPALRDAATNMQAQMEAMLGGAPNLMNLAAELSQAMQAAAPAETLRPGELDESAKEAPTAEPSEGAPEDFAALGQMLGGLDLSSPQLAQLVGQVQAQLAKNPALLGSLAEQLLGGAPSGSAEEDEDDEER